MPRPSALSTRGVSDDYQTDFHLHGKHYEPTGRRHRVVGQSRRQPLRLSIADTADFGILRMVAEQPDEALRLFKDAGFIARETDVIGVGVPDRPGELARIMALLRDQGSIPSIFLPRWNTRSTRQ